MSQRLALARALFSRRWWWKTVLVLAAMATMVALGNWQLDRLAQRRAYNAELQAKLAAAPIQLDGGSLPAPPAELEDRRAVVNGEFDYAHQIAIKNQSFQGQPGVHLVTPLRIEGSDRAVLVNRGWVPYREGTPDRWRQFDEAVEGELTGYLQRSRKLPDGSTTAILAAFQAEWYWLDVEAIATQMPYDLLPVAFQLAPEEGRAPAALPVRVAPEVDLSEGNHLSYALQWYAFALIAGIVYIALVRREEREPQPQPIDLRVHAQQ